MVGTWEAIGSCVIHIWLLAFLASHSCLPKLDPNETELFPFFQLLVAI
jgi:hypothetical protein